MNVINDQKDLGSRFRESIRSLRNRHIFALDALSMLITPFIALALRLDGSSRTVPFLDSLWRYTLSALVIRLVVYKLFGMYNRYWRYASVDDLTHIVAGVTVAAIFNVALCYVASRPSIDFFQLPRSLPFLDSMLTLFVAGGIRMAVRLEQQALRDRHAPDAKRTLVLGAGMAGQMIVRELEAKPELGLRPVGFLDNDSYKHNLRIASLPVFAGLDGLAGVLVAQNIEHVIIAIPSLSGKMVRDIVHACEQSGIPAKTVPTLSAIIDDTVNVSQLRNVEIEDLLRRDPIETDTQSVRNLIKGKRVLVTGAGGSIGSELCRQVLSFGPSDLALLGHGENSVFEIDNELRNMVERFEIGSGSRNTKIHAFIADIRLPVRIKTVVGDFKPDIIFHAAAHKHVPLMELNPTEAITNNVFGTKNVVDAAIAAGTQNFVMISTDKVVNPTNVMGASKRAAEMIVLRAAKQTGRNFVAVRFGNVLGSRGSVVPTFKKMIAAGGPVKVSHPDMKRFFMTIPEAVQLVLQSSVLGKGGEAFMLDMGEPVKIVDLAKDLIELSGLQLGHDIDIVYSGVRPGEKLVEELFINGEAYEKTGHDKVRIVKNASAFVPNRLEDVVKELGNVIATDNPDGVIALLQDLIDEYTPDNRRWKTDRPAPIIEKVTDAVTVQ